MAMTVHFTCEANGTKIEGDSEQLGDGRKDTIECTSYQDAVRTAREFGSAKATGRRTHECIVITKRLCKATPLLAKAMCNNETINGKFDFFRPRGDGTDECFFTVTIKGAQIDSIKRFSPDVMDPAAAKAPPTEEIALRYHTICWNYRPTGCEHEDSWSGEA